jgi:hypothetical protein
VDIFIEGLLPTDDNHDCPAFENLKSTLTPTLTGLQFQEALNNRCLLQLINWLLIVKPDPPHEEDKYKILFSEPCDGDSSIGVGLTAIFEV